MKDINLLPDESKNLTTELPFDSSEKERIPAGAIIIAAIVLVIAIIALAFPIGLHIIKQSQIESLQKQINSSTYNEVRSTNNELASISALISQKKQVLSAIENNSTPTGNMLNSIRQAAPAGIAITEMTLAEGKLDISGYSPNSLLVSEYISAISRLNEVAYTSDTIHLDRSGSQIVFKISFILPGKDGKKKWISA